MLSVPKRLRYFLQRNTALRGAVLRLFLRGVERCLRGHSPGCGASARIGAVVFIHRFGSSLNEHVHFHYCIVDGVFEPAADTGEAAGVEFHAATGLDAAAIAQVQAQVRQRILRAFVRRGLIDEGDRDEMMGWEHGGGFSLDASVCIGGTDRAGLERLLRYCARPPFALEHLHPLDAEHLVYHSPKPRLDGSIDLVLTPLELIGRIAALVPPPRAHRHRYYGMLAPNAALRAAVTALAPVQAIAPPPAVAANTEEEPRHRPASHYLWAMLLMELLAIRLGYQKTIAKSLVMARIYEALPLICPICQAQMRIIAFITDAGTVRKILDHIGESSLPPTISPARGPPLWEMAGQARAMTFNGICRRSLHRSSCLISASPDDEQFFSPRARLRVQVDAGEFFSAGWRNFRSCVCERGGIRIFCGSSAIKIGIDQSAVVMDTSTYAVEFPILERILDIRPEGLHQRVPVILGSKNEVERVVAYHKV